MMNPQWEQQVSKHSLLIHLVDFHGVQMGSEPGPGDPRPGGVGGDESETGLSTGGEEGVPTRDLAGRSPTPRWGSVSPPLQWL